MAGGTAAGLKYLGARLLHRFAGRSAREPRLVLVRFLDDDRADHAGVKRAAILRAEEMERADLGGFKPERRVASGQDVLLHAKRGNKKIVNDVLGGHGQLDRAAERDVNFVDLALPFRMLDLPHPLLTGHEDFHGPARRLRIAEIKRGAPHENQGHDQRGDRGPQHFQRKRSLDGLGPLIRRAPAVLDHEIKNDRKNQRRKKQRYRRQKEIQLVHRLRNRRSLLRLKWKTLHQDRVLTSRAKSLAVLLVLLLVILPVISPVIFLVPA